MPLTSNERQRITDGAVGFGVDLQAEILDRLGLLLDRVYLEWQPLRRVTAVPREQAAERHLLDALVLVPHLGQGARVLDVGSGPGFPGLVLAVVREDLELTLAERSTWLAARLERAAGELGLSRVRVLARDMRPGVVPQAAFDAVVSRAALKPAELIRLARRALAAEGRLLLQLGPRTLEAYRASDCSGFVELDQQAYQLGHQAAQLHLVLLERRRSI